jgi:hypothetical protein
MDENNFVQLCNTWAKLDLFGSRPPEPPWGRGAPIDFDVRAAVESGRGAVPLAYGVPFVDPLERQLQRIVAVSTSDTTTLETIAGAIYQHAAGYSLAPNLKRFLAIISNLYRSFLDRKKRAAADFPVRESLPPLASFKFVGDDGPFTIPVDSIEQLIGGTVGVVSLPAIYADDPVLWASLAHETGGHDVVHADHGLLEELQAGLKQILGRISVPGLTTNELVTLWAYWMDEAVADVYGVLNVGPTFGANLAAFFAALRSKPEAGGFSIPKISMRSVSPPDRPLDVHPTDILRIHLALGVVETSTGLAAAKRSRYVADLKELAALCASGDTVEIAGFAVLDAADALTFDTAVPLSRLQESARQVGRYIATVKLATLGNHSIQDIETWDDADEARAEAVRAALAAGQPIGALGDDAQLLAGATAHLLNVPNAYASVTAALADGLDQSFATDPIWSNPTSEPIFTVQSPSAPQARKSGGKAPRRNSSRRTSRRKTR